ncbi:HNH endonuclease [Streptomyces sp. NBC_01237]|uniref:HNH endonuclease n=1 Tax=Streptomyces sp. NBC_01237 TaxID=2903790 RepID=UPI002DDAFD51|nr:HNH endonuclease signature motif containing protein [Streptomyces sp. NBC_01237]WRZ75388.1 HNH endonuclease [Streptomyces sp. NBC_01237]
MSARHLTASRRRLRKEQLARVHGARCTYCRRRFAALREATLDHIVPVSLYRTWSVGNLALACANCNHAKADRLPLSMALLLVWWTAPDRSAVHPVQEVDVHGFHPVFTTPRDAFIESADGTAGSLAGIGNPPVGAGGNGVDSQPVSTPSPSIDWRLLARLAHARQSATAPRGRPECPGGRRDHHLGFHLRVHPRHRPDRSTRTRLCAHHPTGEGAA